MIGRLFYLLSGTLIASGGACVAQVPASSEPPRHALTLQGESSVGLIATWEDIAESTYNLHQRYEQLQNFQPARVNGTYGMDAFAAFLPGGPVAVGDVWEVDAGAAAELLKQFHPGATASLHHGHGSAPGAWACLRAIGEEHAEILLRVHAEFVLVAAGEPGGPCWLTPSQFAGRMVIDRQRGVVEFFELRVPEGRTNFDVNIASGEAAPGGRQSIIADIGFMPRMDILSAGARKPEATYAEVIGEQDARLRIEQRFYPFAAVDWLSVPDALERAQREGIPMHLVVLFGALEDESC